ncbi:uncharacterized protein LOC126907631 [Daktulosphaira vitifoliae]|uniref:uncharacterized protein LOC126907631 n=1 Tax=Daktulosphaira vitifoliae TaxID=58002 RepID=UPI0021AA2895|nr:uncharacterized protein LOC126907631 [Daktulosphaira vitifoliae]
MIIFTMKLFNTLWFSFQVQFIIMLLMYIYQVTSDSNGCKINIVTDLSSEFPLILDPLDKEIIHPDNYNTIHVDVGKYLLLACPDGQLKNNKSINIQKIECSGNNLFGLDKEKNKISHFICDKSPQSVIKKLETRITAYGEKIVHYKIGFDLKQEGFLKQYDLYFDQSNLTPLYTIHKLASNFNTVYQFTKQSNLEREIFKYSPGFQDVSTIRVYKKSNQYNILHNYLPKNVAKKYTENGHILLRGSLVPKKDFPYTSQQKATLYYFNTAPQWQKFKYGNWKILNNSIRRLAEDRKTNISVYTGVHGVLNIHGKPIYLTYTSSGKTAIPVPSVFWKIVHDVDTDQAIVFIGCNDPFANRFGNSTSQFCTKSLCKQLNWVSFDTDPLKGVMNCCSYKDFSKIIKVPQIEVNDILLKKGLNE